MSRKQKSLDAAIGQAFAKLAPPGHAIDLMDMPKAWRDVKDALSFDTPLDIAVKEAIAKYYRPY